MLSEAFSTHFSEHKELADVVTFLSGRILCNMAGIR